MSNLFLVPAGNPRARGNFENTVREPVLLSDLDLLQPSSRELAGAAVGGVRAWGTKPGRNDVNVATWSAMARDDRVLFYLDGAFPVSGRVLAREHSSAMAKRLWGEEDGETWEYMYLLDDVREVDIPRLDLFERLGYSSGFHPRGFTRVDLDIDAEFGGVEQLLNQFSGDELQWDLRPGQAIARKDLHQRFGGQRQGGISPSAQTANVFVFYDPDAGEQHGYYDNWQADGCLHYTGEGQRGDQEMKAGNAAILNHRKQGRSLRVFRGARGTVTYEGEFELDDAEPVQRADAPETGNGPLREVYVFRLRPIDIQPRESISKLTDVLAGPRRVDVPIEQQETEKAYVNPSREPYEAERREQKLVLALEKHLLGQGHVVRRQRLLPTGEMRPIVTDLFDLTTGTLVEAKGTGQRNAVRMAIGQLFDYRRFFNVGEVNHLAVLLPAEPRADLAALLDELEIVAIYPAENGFDDSNGGGLVNED